MHVKPNTDITKVCVLQLFEEVVEILDPEMNLASDDASIDEDEDEDEVALGRDSKADREKTASREKVASEVE